MNAPTCGGMFDGIGLLAYGLHAAGWQHRWLCESDDWRRDMLARRWPGIPVLGDVRRVGAATVEPVDLIAGGFPCKGASTAGKRNGFEHPETVLWFEMARAVGELRPRFVLVENVANLLSLHDGAVWGTVLGDLAALGYDVTWDCLPAGAVGAPHLRDRVFAVATHADGTRADAHAAPGGPWSAVGERTGTAADAAHIGPERPWGARDGRPGSADCGASAADPEGGPARRDSADTARGLAAQSGRGSAASADAMRSGLEGRGLRRAASDDDGATADADERELPAGRHGSGTGGVQAHPRSVAVEWGNYEPAIQRWAEVVGTAPEPLIRRLDDGDPAVQRMRARMDRSRLSALGDGVQVQVAQLVGEHLMRLMYEDTCKEAA